MQRKHWIDPSQDRPLQGELRVVRLDNGRQRAAEWQDASGTCGGIYADRRGDGIDGIEAVRKWNG